jgi:putative ABC transport system permease protein
MIAFAIRMLVGDRTKYFGVIVGVLFTTFLMVHLFSMVASMISRTFAIIDDVPEADIWVMDPAVEYVEEIAPLPATAVDRVRSVEGVNWAVPLFTGSLRARLSTGQFRSIRVIGVDDATLIGSPRDLISGRPEDLRRADSVIVDIAATKVFLRQALGPPRRGPPDATAPTRPLEVGDELTINDHRVTVVGFAKVSPRFLFQPTIYMTYSHATAISPRERNLLSFVLVHAAPGVEPAALAARIQAQTGFRARTGTQFKSDTGWYVSLNGGVVVRLAIMVGIAVFVGVVITALLLYMFTMENLRYYGTLKALGAGDWTVVRMVAVQAVACGLLGYGLGVGASALLGRAMVRADQPYLLLWQTLVVTGAVVLAVCVIAGAMSCWKVLRLEPGIVFRT